MSAPENPPAFPLHPGIPHDPAWAGSQGMSLRDWFAGQWLAGAVTDNTPLDVSPGESVDEAMREHWANVARAAYLAADAMLAERQKAVRP
jgi:hypothetical protein